MRYIGIDAPEISKGWECFAQEAKRKNQELVIGKRIALEKDVSETDKYQRLLRYVYIVDEDREVFVNKELVLEGYARVFTYPPDVKYQKDFLKAEKEAKENARGLWNKCADGLSTTQSISLKEEKMSPAELDELECSFNFYNCSDFQTQAEAQRIFVACGGVAHDIHRLDSDKDGKACETLP